MGKIKTGYRKPTISQSEVITIMVLFQISRSRHLIHSYSECIPKYFNSYFPKTVSYNRFVGLQKTVVLPMAVFAKTYCLGKCSGISFLGSTPLRVCKNKRIYIP